MDGKGDLEGAKEHPLNTGSTYHRVARLKHLTEQDATLLPGKRFSEGIEGTCVPGVRSIWALQDKDTYGTK